MEGAGVWDTLPCLVVKGVCDYADLSQEQEMAELCGAFCSYMHEGISGELDYR